MIIKRFLALGLVSVLALSAFAGCGKKSSATSSSAVSADATTTAAENKTSEAATEETTASTGPVTLKVFTQYGGYEGVQSGWFGQVMLEKFNVILDIQYEKEDSLDIWLENGSDYDILVWDCNDNPNYELAVEKGYLLNWDEGDLLETKGSYIKNNLTDSLNHNRSLNDGVCYGLCGEVALGGTVKPEDIVYTWDTRWDLYTELNQPKIETLDDYLNLLISMKEICPTDDNGNPTYAIPAFGIWDTCTPLIANAVVSAYYGYQNLGFGFYDFDTDKIYGVTDENGPYYNALKFLNGLYRAGLLEDGIENTEITAATEKVKNGTYLASVFNYTGSEVYNPDHAASNKVMLPLIPENASPLVYSANQTTGLRDIWTINKSTKYPELCMEILNWMATPEGTLTTLYGPKDLTWCIDENKELKLTELGLKNDTDSLAVFDYNGVSSSLMEGGFMVNARIISSDSLIPKNDDFNVSPGQTFIYDTWKTKVSEPACDSERNWIEATGEDNTTQYVYTYKNSKAVGSGVLFTEPVDGDDFYDNWKAVADIILPGSYKCIYAESEEAFNQAFAEMVTAANEAGYAECITYIQENTEK